MNHCVPDFDIQMDDDEYPIPSSSGLPRAKKSFMPDDEIMELLWQNGQVVMQSQNQRSPMKPTPASYPADAVIPAGPSTAREVRSSQQPEVENYNYQNQHLFMQEDEVTSWLHYPIVDDTPLDHNFCADLLYPPPNANNNNIHSSVQNHPRTSQVGEFRQPTRSIVAPRPPIPPAKRTEPMQTKIQNFAHFSKHNARVEPGLPSSKNMMKESTVVDSSDTPAAPAVSRISETVRNSAEQTDIEAGRGSMSSAGVAAPSATSAGGGTGGREVMTCEMTVTSSPGGSSASAEPAHRAPAEDRKRKGRGPEDSECRSEDVDFESADVRKQARGSTSNKRSRAAEVHNLSERRRRDRINEKMRALQELIPRCNKSDKASMLDEAIEYLKSLQLQVQMMSMGCGMVPMMFPRLQQYMAAPPMGMGIGMGMGMGMGMEMGMTRPVMPFPNMLGCSALPAAAAHLGPRFPVPSFRIPPNVPRAPDSSRMQPANQADPPMLNSPGAPDPNQLRIPNFGDPYQQYLGPHQMQFQFMQNQAINQPNFNQPSSSKDTEKPDNHKSEGTWRYIQQSRAGR